MVESSLTRSYGFSTDVWEADNSKAEKLAVPRCCQKFVRSSMQYFLTSGAVPYNEIP